MIPPKIKSYARHINLYAGFFSFFRTALRFLSRNIVFSAINVAGLSAGLAAFFLIALYIQDELSYDAHIREADRMYRLVGIQEPAGLDHQHVAITSGGWAELIKEQFAGAEDVFRIMHAEGGIIRVGEKELPVWNIYRSEGRVLEWLGYDPAVRLDMPNQAVINMETAIMLYGTDDPVGQTFILGGKPYQVIGVIDTKGKKSHLDVNVFVSLSTDEPEMPYISALGNNSVATYIILDPEANPGDLEESINSHYSAMGEETGWATAMPISFYLQPVRDIYLKSSRIKFQMANNLGNISSIYLFSGIALLILAVASINYINLSTAQSSVRGKEVGLRKLFGATPATLAIRFTSESLIITFCAIVIALMLLEFILPVFNTILQKELVADITGNRLLNAGSLGVLLTVGILAGLYPAVLLSRYKPIDALKSDSNRPDSGSGRLRKALVVFQFIISSALIFSTALIQDQARYLQSKDKGFNEKNLVRLNLHRQNAGDVIQDFRHAILGVTGVEAAGAASAYNGVAGRQSSVYADDPEKSQIMVRYGYVDPWFFPVMETGVIKGRNFDPDLRTDQLSSVIINESAARTLGWDDPVGKRFVNNDYPDADFEHHTVIGVVKDYNYYPLHSPVEPALYIYDPDRIRTLNIRISDNDPYLLQRIEEVFSSFFPGEYFDMRSVEDIVRAQYRPESNLMRLFMWFAFLCIIISCLGLFGLTLFVIDQRKREISIRKVLGGSVLRINLALSKRFMGGIIAGGAIALPVSYVILQRWLDNYADSVSIGWHHFAVSFLIVLAIALASIIPFTTRAAMRNPADVLKTE